jgi:hypothetical protein
MFQWFDQSARSAQSPAVVGLSPRALRHVVFPLLLVSVVMAAFSSLVGLFV